ncbi:hypothetical protein [Flavobacterium sp.]|uniref:hypothetical protein n=1 Tax=Flavobacterium sp. TaxID=239 RepID=UPI00286DF804|nr:hypothetical protein [Flavobacterium sp.]
MAKKEMIVAKFNFAFSFLKQLADELVGLIERDLAEFTDRGFTATKKTALQAAIDAVENFPTDEQLQGIKISTTQTKDAARANLETQMRTVFLAAKNTSGEKTGKFREFGDVNLTKQTDSDLVRSAKAMIATATKYVTDLGGEGITAAKIALMTTTRSELDKAIDKQKNAIKDRDNATEARIILANELYDLVVRYDDTGKDIWVTKSEAKYNDYVIYNTPSGTDESVVPPVTP